MTNNPAYPNLGSISKIPEILKNKSIDQIFLVIDRDAYRFSGAEDQLKDCLSKYKTVVFDEFELNPKLDDVKKGVSILEKTPCDVCIAIGGGSAIDVAKLITSFACQPVEPELIIDGPEEISNKGIPVIAVPTTAGTGSEATHFAVVYMNKLKYSVAHDYLLPEYSVVDSELTMSLPASVTMSSGLDALCQGIESFWSVNSTEESVAYAREAVQLAWKNLKNVVLNPSPESRKAMCQASHLAGKAINISKTTSPHAFSYAITTHYGVPHGAAVGLSIAEFFKFNSEVNEKDCQDPRGVPFVKKQISELLEITGCQSVQGFIHQFKTLQRLINAPDSLSSVGITSREQLKMLTEQVNPERMANNPRRITSGVLNNLFQASIL